MPPKTTESFILINGLSHGLKDKIGVSFPSLKKNFFLILRCVPEHLLWLARKRTGFLNFSAKTAIWRMNLMIWRRHLSWQGPNMNGLKNLLPERNITSLYFMKEAI